MKWPWITFCLLTGCGLATKIRQTKELNEAEALAARIQVGIPPVIHQGHDLMIQVETPPEFTFDTPLFPTNEVGTHTIDIPLQYKSIELPYPISYTVSSAESSPQFPLIEGSTYSYNTKMEHTKTVGRFLFFFPMKQKSQNTNRDSLTIEIGAPHIRDTYTEYSAIVRHKEVTQEVRLMGLDGATNYWDGNQWMPFVTASVPSDEHLYAAQQIKCSLAVPGFETCTCNAVPDGVLFAPPGPISCAPFDQMTRTEHTKNKAGGIWFLLSAGTMVVNDSQPVRTNLSYTLGRVENIPTSQRDTDVFWAALHPRKKMKTSEWIARAKRLSKKHTWDMEVAAALYLAHTEKERRTALLSLVEAHPERRALIHLEPAGSASRLELEADLNIDTEHSFTKQILRRRHRFAADEDPHAVLEGVTLSIFDPEQDAMLLDHLYGTTRSQLCIAMARVLPSSVLQEWYDHSRIGASAKRGRTLTHYALENSLGLAPIDPFLEAVSLWFQKGDTDVQSVLANIEREARMHPVTIPTALMLLQTLTFDSTRLEVLARLKDQLPKTERESLLQAFVFKKKEAAKLLEI